MICDDKNHFTLNRNYIESFEYVNQINRPWLEGTLVYYDTNCMLDKFIGSKNTICMVSFNGLDYKKEGNIETTKANPDNSVCHKFMVESIDIKETHFGDAEFNEKTGEESL